MFRDKPKPPMKIATYPLQVEEAHLVEPVQIMMVETTMGSNMKVEEVCMVDYTEKIKVVYPTAKEELIDFLNQCKIKCSEVMLCHRCSAVFDKEATKGLKNIKPQQLRKSMRGDKRSKFSFDKRGFLTRNTNGLHVIGKVRKRLVFLLLVFLLVNGSDLIANLISINKIGR